MSCTNQWTYKRFLTNTSATIQTIILSKENSLLQHINDSKSTQSWSCDIPKWLGNLLPRWHYQMEPFAALLAICEGNPPVTGGFPHQGMWSGTLMFSLISACTNGWANNRDAGDWRRHRAHYDVTVKSKFVTLDCWIIASWLDKYVNILLMLK